MSKTSRKDNKNRVLQKGESQRKDNTYMFRWTDKLGERQCIYAPTLNELREKEFEVQKSEHNGSLYSQGKISLSQAMDRYIESRENIRSTTRQSYTSVAKMVKKDSISNIKIKDIKVSMAKEFCRRMSKKGYKKSYVQDAKRVLHTVLQDAYEADEILKNPFTFTLNFLKDDADSRDELTPELQEELLTFLKNDETYSCYYNLVRFMLNSGLRAGEVCGITKADIDFKNRTINVNKQLRKEKDIYEICPLKTKASYRTVYMFDEAKQALEEIIKDLSDDCITIDGYTDFLFRNKKGLPLYADRLSQTIQNMVKKFKKHRKEKETPKISAHVFRHSFSAYLYTLGLDVQTRMYFMGHKSEKMTLQTYTKVDILNAVNFAKTAETKQNQQEVFDKIA